MVEKRTGKESSDSFPPDVGADWEDAFQAEDFLISPDSSPETLFADGTSPSSNRKTVKKSVERAVSAEAEGEKAATSLKAMGVRQRDRLPPLLLTILETVGNHFFFAFLQRLPGGFGGKWSLLSPATRGASLLASSVILVVLLAAAFYSSDEGPVVAEINAPMEQAGGAKEEALQSLTSNSVEAKSEAPGVAKTESGSVKEAGRQLFPDDNDRHKWRFSSFMIDAGADETGKPIYVAVDLSLVLRLEAGEDFPVDKEYAVRNMIYQFFNNRPPYELQRFSLARGELKQRLMAWFNKEWPDNRVSSIIFHRYQII